MCGDNEKRQHDKDTFPEIAQRNIDFQESRGAAFHESLLLNRGWELLCRKEGGAPSSSYFLSIFSLSGNKRQKLRYQKVCPGPLLPKPVFFVLKGANAELGSWLCVVS